MATLSRPEPDRFKIYRNTRNHLRIHVHDRQQGIHYLHQFANQAELYRYIEDLKAGTSSRVPDALLSPA